MIQRNQISKIIPWLDTDKILIIKGSRQVGKTTLMFLLQDYLKNELKVEEKRIIYDSADSLPQKPYFSSPDLLIRYLQEQYDLDKTDKRVFFFIDEFQFIKEAGRFLKSIFDRYHSKLQIIVSGSSSLEISKNSEFLTGRKIEFHLYPFSFEEYCRVESSLKLNANLPLKSDLSEIRQFYQLYSFEISSLFDRYSIWGGYPEVTLEKVKEKKELILKDIVNTYLQKDVVGFLRIENVSAFNRIAQIFAAQIGSLVNRNEISNTVNSSNATVEKYMEILSGTFVYTFLKPYFSNVRSSLSKMPKVYAEDLGLRSLLLGHLRGIQLHEMGVVAENFVYNELARKLGKEKLRFYRTLAGSEIDFIYEESFEGLWLMEVKYGGKQNIRPLAFKHFMNQFPDKKCRQIVFTRDYLDYMEDVFFIPVVMLPFLNLASMGRVV